MGLAVGSTKQIPGGGTDVVGMTSEAYLAQSDPVSETFQPKTEFGRRLLALRRAYVESEGPLLDADAFERELLQRRGGVSDE